MKKSLALLSAFALLATLGCAPVADRPNIIIIMVDDMGYAGPSIEPCGNPQTVFYRNPVLTHNPKVVLVGMNEAELNKQLVSPLDQSE